MESITIASHPDFLVHLQTASQTSEGWLSTILIMDQCINHLNTWFTSILLFAAWTWIIYRAFQVVIKPTDELIKLLGVDIPNPPVLALSGLKADGFTLHWKPGEQKEIKHILKHNIYVNGIMLQELQPHDNIIIVAGLRPNHGYVVRIVSVSANNFVSGSDPLSLQTLSKSSGEFYSSDQTDRAPATVKTSRFPPDSQTPQTTPIQREHSSSFSQKRQSSSRRQTQSSDNFDLPPLPASTEPDEPDKNFKELNERLERLRIEKINLESQLQSEEEKFHNDQILLQRELQDVQQQVQDKHNNSRELSKQVAVAQREESEAKKKLTTSEKNLEKILQERQKMKDDIKRWESEAPTTEAKIAAIAKEQSEYVEKSRQEVTSIRSKITEESKVNKKIEERIRRIVTEIKEVEETTRKLESSNEEEDIRNRKIEKTVNSNVKEKQDQYITLSHLISQVQIANVQTLQQSDYWKHVVQSLQPNLDTETESANPPSIQNSQNLQNLQNLQNSQNGQNLSNIPNIPNWNPEAHSVNPFPPLGFNRRDSLRRRAPSLGSRTNSLLPTYEYSLNTNIDHSQDDDSFAGNLGSPSAGGLLPAGLFGDETEKANLNESGGSLRGLGIPEAFDQFNNAPSSPNSIPSRSPSAFTSPRESMTHLPFSVIDSDRRSIRSTTGSTRQNSGGGSRFSSIFGLGRQPKKATDISNSSSELVDHVLGRSNTASSLPQPSKRKNGLFGLGGNGTESTRSASISSMENNTYSHASRYGWQLRDGDSSNHRSSPLSAEWGQGPTSNGLGWKYSHNRQSNSFGRDWDDSIDDAGPSSVLAPIGTRPKSEHFREASSGTSAKLNPNAPSFKAFFTKSTDKKTSTEKKAEKPSKRKGKGKDKDKEKAARSEKSEISDTSALRLSSNTPSVVEEGDDVAPHRLSRDGLSLSTLDYSSDAARDSLDQASSNTPSEAGAANSSLHIPRETFMQKLSRKSSVGFTTLAGRGKNKAKRDDSSNSLAPPSLDGSDDILSRSITSNLSVDEKGMPSPASSRGFSLRRLARKKTADKGLEVDEDKDRDEITPTDVVSSPSYNST